MARRKPRSPGRPIRQAGTAYLLIRLLGQLPPKARYAVIGLILLGVLVVVISDALTPTVEPPETKLDFGPVAVVQPALEPDGTGRFQFCFWNLEDLFDDVDDPRNDIDNPTDDAFAQNHRLRNLKLDRLSSALLEMNDGRGPDIIACCEVETERAARLLQSALNQKLEDPVLHYSAVEMINLNAGRHIAPCLITRLPVNSAVTRMHGRLQRILETEIEVNGYPLRIITSHWTSKVSQPEDNVDIRRGRGSYAHQIRQRFEELAADRPDYDFIACGDFNDTPDSQVIRKVLGAQPLPNMLPNFPELFNLLADKSPKQFGTLTYRNEPFIFDQICVSTGMLDRSGWWCQPKTVEVFTKNLARPGPVREPWRFGKADQEIPDRQRGYSDHFPVTVELRVAQPTR